MRLSDSQRRFYYSEARFNVAACGRRSAKTELAKRRQMRRAMSRQLYARTRYIFGAPTHMQAKRIFWADVKAFVPKSFMACQPIESELTVKLLNGAEILVIGLDKPQRIEGDPIDGMVVDEYADVKETLWSNHLRPAVADRQGLVDFIGVPEGRNHFYYLAETAKSDPTGEWMFHHWTSEEILPLYLGMVKALDMGLKGKALRDYCADAAEKEIASAKSTMDELTYSQEFLASFVTFEGLAYYSYDAEVNVKQTTYDPKDDLIFCFDFNVDPGVAVVCQEEVVGSGKTKRSITKVIGEVHIPKNSNTLRVCNKLVSDWGKHEGLVYCYGDASGGARGTAKIAGTDWDLIKDVLRPVFGSKLKFRVPRKNPSERPRVNSVNARLKSANGTVSMHIDPYKAPNLIRDFEGITIMPGTDGEVDKDSDPTLTHMADAIGYYIFMKHPTTKHLVEVQDL